MKFNRVMVPRYYAERLLVFRKLINHANVKYIPDEHYWSKRRLMRIVSPLVAWPRVHAMLCFGLALMVFAGCSASTPTTNVAPSPRSQSVSELTAAPAAIATRAPQPAATSVPEAADVVATASGSIGKQKGKLSPLLAQLADPTVANQSVEAQASALGIPASGAGSLTFDANGAVLVAVRVNSVAEADQQALRDLGASIVNVSEAYSTITVYIPPDRLNDLAASPNVQNIREELHS